MHLNRLQLLSMCECAAARRLYQSSQGNIKLHHFLFPSHSFEHIPSPGLEWLGHLDLSYCDGITPGESFELVSTLTTLTKPVLAG